MRRSDAEAARLGTAIARKRTDRIHPASAPSNMAPAFFRRAENFDESRIIENRSTVATIESKCWSALNPNSARPGRRGCALPRPVGENYHNLKKLVEDLDLHTVCESAACPNIGDCWNRRTATFMILGNVCTRRCGFCAVQKGGSAAGRLRRAPPRRRSLRGPGTEVRRDHQRQSRRSQGRRRGTVRADHPSHPRSRCPDAASRFWCRIFKARTPPWTSCSKPRPTC